MNRTNLIRSGALIAVILGIAAGLVAWKRESVAEAQAAASQQPEPMEAVMAAVAQQRPHAATTTSIGTVIALRSITLRNELPGSVRYVDLTPGKIVEKGDVLVALDVSVEKAELAARKAQAELAKTRLARTQRLKETRAASEEDLDTAVTERDVALAEVARLEAIIARKTIRAPFRARVGISDVHEGQYLNEGSELTTLQGVDDAAYVDFTVAQQVAATLRPGSQVEVFTARTETPIKGTILATDARVDPTTRNAMVRAKIDDASAVVAPGAAVRVRVPVGPTRMAVAIPASAIRKGPSGDHVFVLEQDAQGKTRARVRNVEVGELLGDEAIVESGLTAGERVAASGSFKLRDQVLVSINNPGSSLASAAPAAKRSDT